MEKLNKSGWFNISQAYVQTYLNHTKGNWGLWFTAISLLMLSACNSTDNQNDAYGNFEAVDVMVSSQINGKLLSFNIREGQELTENELLGILDTIQLYLKKEQLQAQKDAVLSRLTGINTQIDVQKQQKRVLEKEKSRIESLLETKSVPAKRLDDVEGELSILEANVENIKSQRATILAESKAIDVQLRQVDDQISDAYIRSPMNGTVLEKYAEPGELVNIGKPLFKIADTRTLELRAFVSGKQLTRVKTGMQVNVFIDKNKDEMMALPGTITWISSEAEFTPKIIQTKEERVDLVYAMKVKVENDGRLKIGMPAEVKFTANTREQ